MQLSFSVLLGLTDFLAWLNLLLGNSVFYISFPWNLHMLYNSISSITYPKFSQYNGLVFELGFILDQWRIFRLEHTALTESIREPRVNLRNPENFVFYISFPWNSHMLYNSISSITYPKFSQYNGLVFELAFELGWPIFWHGLIFYLGWPIFWHGLIFYLEISYFTLVFPETYICCTTLLVL